MIVLSVMIDSMNKTPQEFTRWIKQLSDRDFKYMTGTTRESYYMTKIDGITREVIKTALEINS